MELKKEVFNKLINLIDESKKNKNYEFEVRFLNKNNIIINEENYNNIFQKFTFSNKNNGMNYKYEMKNILDIILDKNINEDTYGTIRMSINGINNIKKYWLEESLDTIDKTFIEKEKIDKIDDNNYNLRFSLNNELPQEEMLEKNKNLLLSNNYEKIYRLKNRYSIITDDNLFSIDMTSVKMGIGKSFKDSNTLKNNFKYEIEIEFIDKNTFIMTDEIVNKLLNHCEIILKLLQNNSNILLNNTFINNIKKYYNNLVKNTIYDNFIAASPVTLHRENLLNNNSIKNIYNKYAVTLKVDGERNFLIVYSSNDENNGKIFIFDSNFNFIDTGYKDEEWIDTLIEGEYVKDNNGNKELYMYDILFSKGIDVRRKHLIDTNTSHDTRLKLLDNFLKSPSRKLSYLINENKCIKLINKKYLMSIRNDGTDIFQKVKDLWDSRKYNNFNVDGIIFVPKYEYYPLRGGSWWYLFKWKPPHLNTIDFLIKTVKDNNNKSIRYPYIDIINRPDGKKEKIIKQYLSIKLFVSGDKIILNQKKKIPVLFNPYKMDNKNSEIYNLVKIIIEDDGKIYANNPITNEKEEIYDDIIVEFGYDETKEEGFKWVPHKFRKDKTNAYKNGKEVFGNGEKTANDIFKAINNPVTEDMIITGNIPPIENIDLINQKPYYLRNENGTRERFKYQNFHNHYIKYQLFYFSSPSYIKEYTTGFHGKLLDLCCGKGVDFNKIKRAKYEEIIGMDIDYNNIKEAKEWFKTMVKPPPAAYYVRGDSSKLFWPEQECGLSEYDKITIKKYIPSKYIFDTISLQFCFHYFFKDEISFRTLLQNINDNLKIGGFIIGTTFDGEKVYDKLKNVEFINGKTKQGDVMWRIDKKYSSTKLSFTDKKANFGKNIDVFIKTIGAVHEEYLVNFHYMDKIMQEYGFTKVFVKPFEDFYNELSSGQNLMDLTNAEIEKDMESIKGMSEDEKNFSFLSSAFMYKKEKNSSDSLMKKLIEMIEKKHKLKKEDNVFVVSENIEHTIEDI